MFRLDCGSGQEATTSGTSSNNPPTSIKESIFYTSVLSIDALSSHVIKHFYSSVTDACSKESRE